MNHYDSYYPRPLLRRNSFFSLNGKWKLNGKDIEIPFPPESRLSGYNGDLSRIDYYKEFVLTEDFYEQDKRIILNFGAVDQICDVYLNNEFLVNHEGGYLPFSIDITENLKETNILEVKVKDELDYFYPYGKQSKNPKGMWYTPVSGIWQSVWIEAVPKDYIRNIHISTDMNTLNIHIDSDANEFEIEFAGYKNTFNNPDIKIEIADPILWDLDNPHLYDLHIKTNSDEISSYFALRKIDVKEINGFKRIFLNDKPVFINGLLDQGYFEDGIFSPENEKDYEKDIVGIKELGFNCLRKHIKVEPEAFYYYCDKHGVLVMQDMVNSGAYSFFTDTVLPTIGLLNIKKPIKDKNRYEFFLNHSIETINHLKSHPCIFAYTIYNEGWGQQDASGTYSVLKKLDSERLFDSTSGWFFDKNSDFDSYHIYFRNKVLNAGKNILSLSECGGFIRDIAEHRSEKGSKWGYGSADSEEALTDKIIEMYEKMYIPSIRNGLCMAIMTQISDVEGEINGLYTYDRKILKVNKDRIIEANKKLQEIYINECIKKAL